ncbi:CDP-alcohol phosphatidyltransferase family protein [Glycomyces terrestris]|uniref:CDP-alcohol phosphatidyltransferase family protein n=1 Tax=Glycomyces terrestris TaxID=2493553 RepID=A0A426UW08_9ACTN|nr:CDP-alcohol phosphatidyltransferase family protein [Glycomyces terrestris]RRR98379.1 CDP-alcohol phosphatidyltransferase family protein [Glycomyces terrestris]
MSKPAVTAPPAGWGVWTWPNLVTAVRLLGIPLFCYLLLATQYYWQAAVVLAVGSGTDWVDGQLARHLNQVSRLGRLLDPFVDRLYILTALLALTYTGLLPWLFTLAALAREAVMVAMVIVLRWHGHAPPQVHFLGKAATAVVFCSFPVLVIAGLVPEADFWAKPFGWALAWWGLGLYWLAAIVYLRQAAGLLKAGRPRTEIAA